MGILHRAPEGRGSLCVCVWGGEGVGGWGRQPCIWLQGCYGQKLVAHSLCQHLFSPVLLAALTLERFLLSTFLTTILSHRMFPVDDNLGVSSAMTDSKPSILS